MVLYRLNCRIDFVNNDIFAQGFHISAIEIHEVKIGPYPDQISYCSIRQALLGLLNEIKKEIAQNLFLIYCETNAFDHGKDASIPIENSV